MRLGSEWGGDGEEKGKTMYPISECQLTSYCFAWSETKTNNELNVLIQFIWLNNLWLSNYVFCKSLNVDCQTVHPGRKKLFTYNGLMIVWQLNYTAGEFWKRSGEWRQVCLSTLNFTALSWIWRHSILHTEQISHSTHSKELLGWVQKGGLFKFGLKLSWPNLLLYLTLHS